MMADLERLVSLVHRQLGRKRIWLTSTATGRIRQIFTSASPKAQARHVASAARRVEQARFVDMLIFFLVRDDAADDGWQSGFTTADGVKKPAYTAFRFPLERTSRSGAVVGLWGQVRPRAGPQSYRLRILRERRLELARRHASTNARGVLSVRVRVAAGSVVQLWSVRDRAASLSIRV